MIGMMMREIKVPSVNVEVKLSLIPASVRAYNVPYSLA